MLTAQPVTEAMAVFVATAAVPKAARTRAATAILDTVGVILAGAPEPAPTMVRSIMTTDDRGPCRILGTTAHANADEAALANGVAAHALDYDDMCFVSLAHPSCALLPAALAAAELTHASGRALLDAYIVGFELECRLGLVMNPRHYHVRGWHCTSSIGTIGAAATASRLLGLTPAAITHALGIAASSACGLKENLGTMVKPLHAGLAARNGIMAARLAREGFTASPRAIDGPQGYLAAMDSERSASALVDALADLDSRWEILDTGVTVKLYPSCAATHPPLDVILDLAQRHGFGAGEVDAIAVEVDSMTPRLLIYDRPTTALEGKFSMPFCAAAALVFGHPTLATFDEERIRDPRVQALMPRVTLRTNPAFDTSAPLSQTNVSIRLLSGNTIEGRADGARGYPGRLSEDELTTKFLACAQQSLSRDAAHDALRVVRDLEHLANIASLTDACAQR